MIENFGPSTGASGFENVRVMIENKRYSILALHKDCPFRNILFNLYVLKKFTYSQIQWSTGASNSLHMFEEAMILGQFYFFFVLGPWICDSVSFRGYPICHILLTFSAMYFKLWMVDRYLRTCQSVIPTSFV